MTDFDIVITVGPDDIPNLHKQVEFAKKNIIGYRNIYLISYDPSLNISGCITVDEAIFPFNIETVACEHAPHKRNRWYLQKLLKLYAGLVIPDIMDRYLVVECDHFFLHPTSFVQKGICLYSYGSEFHIPYFQHMIKLHPAFNKMTQISGICNHMVFETKYINEIITMVEGFHSKEFYMVFLSSVATSEIPKYGASEYELYFNYMLAYHKDCIIIRKLENPTMDIKFITFGSHDNYMKAAERLITQAKTMNVFTDMILYTPDHLKNDLEFWTKHGTFITENKRGYGYWLWKSFLVKKTMGSMRNGDILLYLDCGCELSPTKRNELLESIEIVKKDKIVGTYVCLERDWTKMDLIRLLDVYHEKYLHTQQHQAGALLFLVCDETRELVNRWYEVASDYHNIDDSPSILENLYNFQEHRHDQSIFSLLTKKYNMYSKNTLDTFVFYLRNISGDSRI